MTTLEPHHPDTPTYADAPPVAVEVPASTQALVYFPGDSMALWLDDHDTAANIRDVFSGLGPVARAVMVTRLRMFADILDTTDDGDDQ